MKDHDIDPVAELQAAVDNVAGELAPHDADRLRYWAQRVVELVPASGPISDRLRADSEALARHGNEQEHTLPGETRS